MSKPDDSSTPHSRLDRALEEFRQAWLEGERPDPDAFCRGHPKCGAELAERIHEFLYVAEGLDEMADSRKEPSSGGPSAGHEDLSGMTLGDFRIVSIIGRGGMGTVFEAVQISLRRRVALKVLPSHLSLSDLSVQKFHREAEAGGRQSHPGIVAVHAVGEFKGRHFIAQELVPGGRTLSDRIKELGTRSAQPSGHYRKLAGLFVAIAEALEHAHQAGVIHRDIKPSNILLDPEGRPKVTDFGLAKVEDALALSRSGEFAGTPYYMSPEQAMRQRRTIDKRTDIYSLGVTLYETLTLKRPFEGETSLEILKQIIVGAPRDPRKLKPRVPRDLAVICLKAMAKTPEERYQRVAELAADLERYRSGDAILARPTSVGVRAWKFIQRHPVASAAGTVALLAAIAFIAYELLVSLPAIRKERDKAEKGYREIIRLADVKRLSDLKAESERLWPAFPHMEKDLNAWRERAKALGGRLDAHRSALENLGRAEEPSIDGIALEWQYGTLAKLIEGIEGLIDPETGEMESVRARIDIASSIKAATIDRYRSEWASAVTSIGDETLCPQYKGLVFKEQIGFIPLGPDPASGLWEFAHYQTGAPPPRGSDGALAITKESGLVFVLIPGGTFSMGATRPADELPAGSPNVDPHAKDEEGPVHEVTVPPFLLAKFETTQAQWERFTGNNPSYFGPDRIIGGKQHSALHPVECVSWSDCEMLLFRLGLRFPTEAEWEYAIRAGTTTVWFTGDDKRSLDGAANVCDLAWKRAGTQADWPYDDWLDDGYGSHAPVGSFRPNAYGLFDVHGNVMEWCRDNFAPYADTPVDGSAYESQGATTLEKARIYRGGGWDNYTRDCRSAFRDYEVPELKLPTVGIRPAASLR